MKDKFRVLISAEEVERRIQEIADEISRDYAGKTVHLVGILKGSVFIVTEIAKRLTIPATLDFMSVSSYEGTESTGRIKLLKDLDDSIEGKEVLIIEDIVDTGRTMSHLMKVLNAREPKSLKLCTLLDKPGRREVPVKSDYIGFSIEDLFVIGYGLDYNQKYRNLPYIGVMEEIGDE